MEAAKEKKLLKFVKRNHNGKTGALKQFFFSFIYVHVHVHVESSLSLHFPACFLPVNSVSTQTSRRHIRLRRPFCQLYLRSLLSDVNTAFN